MSQKIARGIGVFRPLWFVMTITVAAVFPHVSGAQCVNTGGSVTCSGTDTTGFSSAGAINSLTVNSGATVTDSGGGIVENSVINIDAAVTGNILINGSVTSTAASNTALTVSDLISGTVTINSPVTGGTDSGGVNFEDVDGLISVNANVSGGDVGFDTSSANGGFTNNATITSSNRIAVDIADAEGAGITNNGTISGQNDIGVEIVTLTNGGFRNSSGARITSENDEAVQIVDIFAGGFRNDGEIISSDPSNSDGFDNTGGVAGGDFINTGVIRGTGHGVDSGDLGDITPGNFTNSGTIQGGSGEGLDLSNINDGNFTNTSSGVIRSTNNTGVDINAIREGAAGDGNFTNAGRIEGGTGEFSNGVRVGDVQGDFVNSGTITSAGAPGDPSFDTPNANGVEIGELDGNFTNSGTISQTGTGTTNLIGVRINDFRRTNQTFTNTGSGTISGRQFGIRITPSDNTAQTFTLIN